MNKYTLVFQSYGAAQQIDLGGANSVTFYNVGTDTAYIEGVPILPSAQLSIEGNECEVTFDILQLTFNLTAGLTQNMSVIKKVFTQGYSNL
jgi:hypothetical protein